VGTFVGQLLFGWLADVYGRKRMYGIELLIIIIGTFGQVLAGQARGINIFNVLIFYRFIMGIGIGGDYPSSAVISSEFSNVKTRGRLMTAVFSAQGWGQFVAAVISIIIAAAFKQSIEKDGALDPAHVDKVWRALIGLGAVPAFIGLYLRLLIPETPRYTMDIERNLFQAMQDVDTMLRSGRFAVNPDLIVQRFNAPRASSKDFFRHFANWRNGKVLLGTAYSWFALDIAFYGLNLNSSIILNEIGFAGTIPSQIQNGAEIYETIRHISIGNVILSLGGLIPGYYATMLLIDSWGRKPIQLMGFALCLIIFCCMGTLSTFKIQLLPFPPKSSNGLLTMFLFLNTRVWLRCSDQDHQDERGIRVPLLPRQLLL
jgi:MFS transporter, PHS family, inorganic phosphate transporter